MNYRSTINGFFGTELKFAGWDGIIVKGKASKPVYLLIEDDQVSIRDAGVLWGLDSYATQQNIFNRHSNEHQTLTIGPAGEHLVRSASIMHGVSHCTGYGGMGAVMGAKNLKAIVARGTGAIPVANAQMLFDCTLSHQSLTSRKEGSTEVTPMARGNYYGPVPTKDSLIRAEGKKGTARIGFSGCPGCNIHCGMTVRLNDGSIVPGGNLRCQVDQSSVGEIAYDKGWFGRSAYGRIKSLDLNGLGIEAAWGRFAGLVSAGVLTNENTGLDLSQMGTPEFTQDVIHKMAWREGIGDKWGDGLRVFCTEHMKDDPKAAAYYEECAYRSGRHRADWSWLGQGPFEYYRLPGLIDRAVANMGGPENRGLYVIAWKPYTHPLVTDPAGPEYVPMVDKISKAQFGSEQAARDIASWTWGPYNDVAVIYAQNWVASADSLPRCTSITMYEPFSAYTPDRMGDLYHNEHFLQAVTGIDWYTSDPGGQKFGAMVYALERSILARQGHNRADDWCFDSQFELYKDKGLTKEQLNQEITSFYKLRGMNPDTALPTMPLMESLGLKDIADDLQKKYGVTLSTEVVTTTVTSSFVTTTTDAEPRVITWQEAANFVNTGILFSITSKVNFTHTEIGPWLIFGPGPVEPRGNILIVDTSKLKLPDPLANYVGKNITAIGRLTGDNVWGPELLATSITLA
jgi:aldehyde:ferredoxin oxidoreductase